MQLYKKIQNIVEKEMGYGPISNQKECSIKELGMDYLDLAELIVLVEKKFDIIFESEFNLEETALTAISIETRQQLFKKVQKLSVRKLS